MAIGKTAGCLILAGAAWLSAAQFPVRHEHWRKACEGVLTVNEDGVAFAGPNGHAFAWKFEDIEELRLAPGSIHILTYKDSRVRMGADEGYEFTGDIPAGELYRFLAARMDQRFVAELAPAGGSSPAAQSIPAKLLGRVAGSEGTLAFGAESIVWATPAKNASRAWRYGDIDSISSAGRFDLTVNTRERDFHFQLKRPITEARYNELWLQIEKKNGRIQ
jgi:hypothetical protein